MTLQVLENQEAGPLPAEQEIIEDQQVVDFRAERLIAQAIERGLPVESLERLLAMRERLKAERAREAFFDALTRFQSECPVIPKVALVFYEGKLRYRYAPLGKIIEVVAPLLTKHGLSYSFDTAFKANPPAQIVTCTVHHVAGHSQTSTFRSPIDPKAHMNEVQKSGSSLTYGKRYALSNALGIVADEDDDGRGSGQVSPEPSVSRPPKPSLITAAQKARLTSRVKALNLKWSVVKRWVAQNFGLNDLNKLTEKQYSSLDKELEKLASGPACAQGPSFEEALRLAKLAEGKDDRELVQDLARTLTPEQRSEVERVLAEREQDYLDAVRENLTK
jgi:ERF superfamily